MHFSKTQRNAIRNAWVDFKGQVRNLLIYIEQYNNRRRILRKFLILLDLIGV